MPFGSHRTTADREPAVSACGCLIGARAGFYRAYRSGIATRAPALGSNTGMDTPHTTDKRLTELEIRSTYAEDLLDTLNQTIFRQQEQIDMLIQEVRALRQQSTGTAGQRNLRDDLPPHY